MSRTEMQTFGTTNRIGHNSDGFYKRKMFVNVKSNKSISCEENICPKDVLEKIYNHSSEDMYELPDNSVHLMVTSPPYNVGKDYDDDLTEYEYLDLLYSVWKEVYRVLSPGGRACINVANLGRKPYLPLNAIISQQMREIGYLMRGEIIWDKSASAGTSCAWGSWKSASNPVLRDIHEYILVFSKEDYKRPAMGRTSTISKEEFLKLTKSVWTFPAESAKRVKHPAPFPIELPRRLIELYTYSGDVVLDPFLGSGTTAVAAMRGNRHYIGYETSEDYVKISKARLRTECESLFV
ncbi:site-specific DNA-methyltransferase [Candidatus Poribacteria bacterium]|nr:site-specific DNA-methyltransferase [Candidatus Poribacteria bacterium]